MPIFQAESRIFFDPFLLFEPGEVLYDFERQRKTWRTTLFFFTFPFQKNFKARHNGQGLLVTLLPRPAGGELLDSGSGNVSCIIVSGVNFSVPGVF